MNILAIRPGRKHDQFETPSGRQLELEAMDEPHDGYQIRGGGQMFDGNQFFELYPRGGELCQVEAPTDRSCVSGSGRSGRVRYRLRDWAYRIITVSGGIASQCRAVRYAVRFRGRWYEISKNVAMLAMGIDPEAQQAAERLRRAEMATPIDDAGELDDGPSVRRNLHGAPEFREGDSF